VSRLRHIFWTTTIYCDSAAISISTSTIARGGDDGGRNGKDKICNPHTTLEIVASLLALSVSIIAVKPAVADEGGVSFWVPGFFGSLAATPQQPGFSFATIYYHTSVSAGGNVAFARQVSRGNITANFSGSVNANLDAKADLVYGGAELRICYSVFGGQATMVMLVPMDAARYQSMLLSTVLWDHSVLQDRPVSVNRRPASAILSRNLMCAGIKASIIS